MWVMEGVCTESSKAGSFATSSISNIMYLLAFDASSGFLEGATLGVTPELTGVGREAGAG